MKKIIPGVVITLLLLGGIAIYLKQSHRQQPTIQNESHDDNTMDEHENEKTVLDKQVDLTAEKNVTVRIKDFKYTPSNIKIKKGATVTWINEDEMEHNAMQLTKVTKNHMTYPN